MMYSKKYYLSACYNARLLFTIFLSWMVYAQPLMGATIQSTATGGDWSNSTTWVGGVVPGATDDVEIATTGGNAVTLSAPVSCAALTVNLDAILNAGTHTISISGNLIVIGTFTSPSGGVTFTGTGAQLISAFTTGGNITMAKTGGTATFVGNMNANQLTINGTGGTLNLGISRTHTFTGNIQLTAGTLEGGSSTLNFSGAWNGTGSNFVPNTSTVVLAGAGQTINTTTTFYNLTYGGTGGKTIAAAVTVTVNTIFTIANGANTNTYTGTLAYGPSAGLRYNVGTSNRTTTNNEWPSPFVATGGVTINGTTPGTITLNAAKQMGNNTNVPLTLNPGSTLSLGGFNLTLHGDFINNATLSAGSSNIIVAGTVATQNIAGFNTLGQLQMTKTAGTATLTSSISVDDIVLNGSGGTLDLGSATHTVADDITLTAGTMLGNTSTLSVGDEFTATAGIFTGGSFNLLLPSGNGQNIVGFTTTGNITVTKTGATATFTGNVSATNLSISGSGTISLGTGGFTHTFSGGLTRTAGTLDFGTNTIINLTGSGTVITGTIAAGTNSTLVLAGGAQTVATLNTFEFLRLAGTGSKTFSGALTINDLLTIENGSNSNSFISLNYGTTGGLRYDAGASNRTVGGEWPGTFPGAGGVTIRGTGVITLDAAKTIGNGTAPSFLTIDPGATLATANFQITLQGNFTNNGTFTAGSSNMVISGTLATQSIGTFTTTGTLSIIKTAGIATLTGAVNAGGLIINGAGGTLNMGTALSHSFSGTWTRTAGTLDLNSSTISFSLGGTMFSGAGGIFTPGTGTVAYTGAAQTCPELTYNNLTLSGSGVKTFATTPTVNGTLTISGTSSIVVTTGVVTYGPNAALRYNRTTALTISNEEFPTTFSGSGGVIIDGTGEISMAAPARTIDFILRIETGAVLNLGTLTHSCRGLIRGGGPIAFGNFGGTGSGAVNIDAVFFAPATGQLNSLTNIATWTGAINTDWHNAGNWAEGSVPTALIDAIINLTVNQPVLTAAAITKNLQVNAGATLNTAGFQLTLHGTYTNSGTVTFGASNIILAGGLDQFVAGINTTGNITSNKPTGTARFTGNLTAASITLSPALAGVVNLGAGNTHTISGNLTINGGTFRGGNSTLLLSGNTILGVGTFTGDTVNLTLSGTAAQSIVAFTTLGTISMTKTAGTATLTGGTTAGALTINGAGGTLNLVSGTYTINGAVTLTNGTLNGGTSTLNVTGNWNGTGTVFTAGTSTVAFTGGAQTINTTTTFNNLTYGGTGGKTIAAAVDVTVNNIMRISNGANANTFTGTLTYGSTAGLRYSPGADRTAGAEWPNTFVATGGIIIETNTITLNAAKVLNAGVNLTLTTNLTTNNFALTTEGNITGGGTFTGGSSNITFTGTAAQSIRALTTTGTVSMTKTAGTVTLTGNLSTNNLTINGAGGTISMGTGLTHTITGNFTVTAGTINFNNCNVTFSGTATQSIAGFTTTGNISMTKTGGTATFAGNVSAAQLIINGVGGTLNAGTGLSHTFSGIWTRTNGTLNGGSSTITFTVGGAVVSGAGGTFTPGTGTIAYGGAAQTVGALTYYNLVLSNSGIKTTSASVIVDNILTMEGTATVSAAITYGGDASLRYNRTSPQTTGVEFPNTFSPKGGVIIGGTGLITLDAAKTILSPLSIETGAQVSLSTFSHSSEGLNLGGSPQVAGTYGGTTSGAATIDPTFFATATGILTVTNPNAIWQGTISTDWSNAANWSNGLVPNLSSNVTINSGTPFQPILSAVSECGNLLVNVGATLQTAGFQLSIFGDFTPTGTVTFGSSNVIIAGIFAQNIGTISTTGNVTMTKTANTATVSGNISANSLILNGTGGTLNLGAALTHTFTGNITITAGTLVGSSANIIITGTATQSIGAITTTGNFTSTKTGGTATLAGNLNANTLTVNGVGGTLNLGAAARTHTLTGDVTITAGTLNGGAASMNFTGTAAQSIAGFNTTGNITINKTGGAATFSGNLSMNNLTVTAGTLNLGSGTHTFTGNITGTLASTSASLVFSGTAAQSIASLTTTGNITSTKTGGTATFAGNISVNNLTLNGSGGTVNLGSATHTISGDIQVIAGTLTGATSSLVFSGTANQNIAGFTTTGGISMIKTGGGTATFTGNVQAGSLTLNGLGGILNLGNGLTHTISGTWTRSNGTLDGGTSTLNFTAAGIFISGSAGSFIPNGGTVNYAASANQTIGAFTYNNLTVSGSGIKSSTGVTVNGTFSMQGTATISDPITYGSAATLEYNRSTPYTTTINEFPNIFLSSGGVVIGGTGTITLNDGKTIAATLTVNTGANLDLNTLTSHTTNGLVFGASLQTATGTYGRTGSGATNINDVFFASGTSGTILLSTTLTSWLGINFDWSDPTNWTNGVPTSFSDVVINSAVPQQPIVAISAEARDITINTSATLTTVGLPFSIYGNLTNNGVVSFGSSNINISGTATQSIDGFSTTGSVSVTKLGGVATMDGNLDVQNITMSGAGGTFDLGAGTTHTLRGNLTVSAGTLVGNSANLVITGTANQTIAGYTSTGNITSTKTGGTATLTGNVSVSQITVNGSGGTLNLGAGLTHVLSGNLSIVNGTLNGGSATVELSGNLTNSGTLTGNAMNLTLAGTATQSIAGLTTTGNIQLTKTAGTATFTGNINANQLTLNGTGGTLNLGTGRTHTFTGDIALTNGTLQASNAIINISSSTTTAWSGTGSNFVAGTSTVNFTGNDQTIATTTTFNNLTLAGSGIKTLAPGTTTTINGTHTIQNGSNNNVFTGATLNYGPAAALRYNVGADSRTASSEWPATFSGTGGITIDGIAPGTITLNGNKQIGNNTATNLQINAGATLATNNFSVEFHGNFTNSGTFTAGSSDIIIGGNQATQNINGYTTTGNTSMTKSAGTATITGNVSAAQLLINGSGGTLNAGVARTHTFSGDVVLTAGSLQGGSSTFNLTGTSATAWSGTGSLFVPGTSTVNFSGGAQTIATATTFHNLTASGTGDKTVSANITVNSQLNVATGRTLNLTTTVLSGASLTTTGTGTIRTQNNSATPIPASRTWTQTVSYDLATGGQTIVPGIYANLNSGATSGTNTVSGNITVSGNLDVSAGGVLNMATHTLSGVALTTSGTGTLRTQNTSATPLPSGRTWSMAVSYDGSASQTIISGTYNTDLITSGSASKTMSGNSTVNGILNLSSKLALGSNTLTLNGIFTGSSVNSLTANGNSNVVVGPSGSPITLFFDQTINGTTNRIQNLTYNRSGQNITINTGDTLRVSGNITPTAGTLVTNNVLVLVSDAAGTANLLSGSGTYITGSVKVQRHIPAIARRWRFVGSSVPTATLEDLRQEVYVTGPGTGITVGTLNSNGFDATLTNNPGVYWYTESVVAGNRNNGWDSATSVSQLVAPNGKGMRLFVRGDRSDLGRLNATVTTQNTVTVDINGAVNTGDIAFHSLGGLTFTSSGSAEEDGWNLLSNPYPSAYDWNAFHDAGRTILDSVTGTNYSNIQPTIYVYNPNTNNYAFYNALSNTGTLTNGIIPSGASFWVKASGASPTMTFTESFKTSAVPASMFKSVESGEFTVRLVQDAINTDDVIIKYVDSSTVNNDIYDVRKFFSGVALTAWGPDSVHLALSARPLSPFANDTIRLCVWAPVGTHSLQFVNSGAIAVSEQVYLVDNFTNSFTNIKQNSSYTFSVTGNPASQGMARFYIVVVSANPIPLTLVNFSARATADQTVSVEWSTINEINTDYFEVQRSIDGINFQAIDKTEAAGQSTTLRHYRIWDTKPMSSNYYRLRMVDVDGTFTYSPIIKVVLDGANSLAHMEVYPNPTAESIQITQPDPLASIRIVDGMGKVLQQTTYSGETQVSINLASYISGFYLIETTALNGTKQVMGVIKE